VRVAPNPGARAVTRLRYNTEDRHPEVYVALARHVTADGSEWVKVRVPMRPHGKVGWVPRESLGLIYTVRTRLEIDRAHTRATLFREGKRVWSARVGVGAPGTPTPRGRFYIREVLRDFPKGTIYGPLAFGTSAYSRQLTDWPGGGVIGIHGTNQPKLIPGRPSHGCVRVRNPDIRRLAKLMPLGTPVVIR